MEYGEVSNKVGGFSLEKDYDYKLSKYEDKDKLTMVMEWNKQEDTVELNLLEDNYNKMITYKTTRIGFIYSPLLWWWLVFK
ncbi:MULTISPECIES: hypothetical protein [Clostridium]|jgi:hypothetical protein|uniref:hypothetical protein n=1 Tax=Clostridium TaxID=1485 RepID=UPI000DD08DE3|nr:MULTISPECIES: hypothetical protein [Clostridium]MBU6135315.1 hypothetical protein [Clostridium tertium]MDB1949390.1 hypothetical protein [Clostridium tertium]MDB1955951.1 hypothetical protein [Clostridium tertium]MDB1960422.1 hypothetical protein [Clostridium tertium]MDB1964205.1 hypothetical protein [Clostridium tertium]